MTRLSAPFALFNAALRSPQLAARLVPNLCAATGMAFRPVPNLAAMAPGGREIQIPLCRSEVFRAVKGF